MSDERTIDLAALRRPFPARDIEWRLAASGTSNGKPWARVVAYITNRAIMERLDDVCGPDAWMNDFTTGPGGGVLCGLMIRIDDKWITKWDGADNTDIESVKGGLSDAMKRAAVQWGIGRYLYRLPEGWAAIHAQGIHFGKTKDGTTFRWDPPALPGWAVPDGDAGAGASPGGGRRAAPGGASPSGGHAGERATPAQIEEIQALVKAEEIPADKRERIQAKIAEGMSQTEAENTALWLKRQTQKTSQAA